MGPTSSTTDPRRAGAAVAALLVLLGGAQPAVALIFEPQQLRDGRWILYVRDCGLREKSADCDEWQRAFRLAGSYKRRDGRTVSYGGDAAVLDGLLRQRRYEEVWLHSGGGHLQAGIDIGRVLRRHRATVRVPDGAYCVSACTVAFMGGLFRFVDDGATYEVHAGSWVSQGLGGPTEALVERGDFAGIARRHRVEARKTARQLLTHFQNTLIIPLRARPQPEDDAEFARWARTPPAASFYDAAQAELDRQRIAVEGLAAAQDIIMRIEREAMRAAIADLRLMIRNGGLGPRAEPALRMVEAMYDVSIKETAVLTKETMLRMGYITQEVRMEGRN